MFGILYLILCFCVGNLICRILFPTLREQTAKTLKGNPSCLPSFFVTIPAWFVTGVLTVAWSTYLLAYLFRNQDQALRPANRIVFIVFCAFVILGNLFLHKRNARTASRTALSNDTDSISTPFSQKLTDQTISSSDMEETSDQLFQKTDGQSIAPSDIGEISNQLFQETDSQDISLKTAAADSVPKDISLEDWIQQNISSISWFGDISHWIYLVLVTMLVCSLMFITFYFHNGQLWIGSTVFGDFAPHIAVIRSFSRGNNFPTVYPHFGGQDIKYHFMFQFLVGNLEFLGLRLDLAFNLPSILCMVNVFLLLYALIYRISEKKSIAMMSGLFFAFRSSWALFDFVKEIPSGNLWQTLRDQRDFIGTTVHEDWGLYNLNVYVNQRHLALGMTIMLFVIYQMMDYFYASLERNRDLKGFSAIRSSFFTPEGWQWKSPVFAIGLGLLLGMAGFFHGSCVIACLLVLFVLAAASDHRLDFVLIAGISVFLVVLQSRFFTNGSVGSVSSIHWYFGFLAENRTIFGVIDFLNTSMGILPVLILCVLVLSTFELRWLILAFSAPLIFAFTISMTPDINVNHKYILISSMLLGSFAAMFIDWLWNWKQKNSIRIACFCLAGLMTCTGIYEYYLVAKKNIEQSYYLDDNTPAVAWLSEHTSSHSLFLTTWDTLNPVVQSGASMYLGWPYYAWSAGYDTDGRMAIVKQLYGSPDRETLTQAISEQHIDYILINQEVRNSQELSLNEALIIDTYECVYSDESMQIYDTARLLN